MRFWQRLQVAIHEELLLPAQTAEANAARHATHARAVAAADLTTAVTWCAAAVATVGLAAFLHGNLSPRLCMR